MCADCTRRQEADANLCTGRSCVAHVAGPGRKMEPPSQTLRRRGFQPSTAHSCQHLILNSLCDISNLGKTCRPGTFWVEPDTKQALTPDQLQVFSVSLSVTIFAGCSPNNCIQGGARLSVSSHPVIDAAPKNPCGIFNNMRVVRKEPPCSAQESVLLCTREGTACADLDLLSFKIPAMCLCHCLAALHQRRPFHQFNLNAQ